MTGQGIGFEGLGFRVFVRVQSVYGLGFWVARVRDFGG